MATKKLIAQAIDYANTLEQIKELKKLLKTATDHQGELETGFKKDLADGMHPVGKFVLEVKTETKKGRKSPSWKSIAEGVSETLPGISEALGEKFPAEAESFGKFEAEATALYTDLCEEHTKVGPSTEEKTVTLHDVAGKADKKAEAEAEESQATKPHRKHHLRVAG
jgi:hypothetical protein